MTDNGLFKPPAERHNLSDQQQKTQETAAEQSAAALPSARKPETEARSAAALPSARKSEAEARSAAALVSARKPETETQSAVTTPPIKKRPAEAKKLSAAEKKKKKNERRILRIVIQVFFFVMAPALFTSAFSGIKQFFSTVHQGEPLAMNGFFAALIALCVFTMLFGRYFCGYACAFGSLGDFVYFLSEKVQKKTGKRLPKLPDQAARVMQHLPFVILVLIMLFCALGVYDKLPGWSPWEVFSLVTAGNFHLGGSLLGIVLFLLIAVGMAAESRFFCRFLCPMGAVFRLLPVFPWALLKRDRSQCIKGCSACQKVCPVNHELAAGLNAGDCIRCGKCIDICPKGNISIGTIKENPVTGKQTILGNEFWLTALKAVILFIIAIILGAVRFL